MKSLAVISIALSLLACSSAPTMQADNDNQFICEKEMPIGSNIAAKRCRREADVNERRENDKQAIEKLLVPRTPTSSGR